MEPPTVYPIPNPPPPTTIRESLFFLNLLMFLFYITTVTHTHTPTTTHINEKWQFWILLYCFQVCWWWKDGQETEAIKGPYYSGGDHCLWCLSEDGRPQSWCRSLDWFQRFAIWDCNGQGFHETKKKNDSFSVVYYLVWGLCYWLCFYNWAWITCVFV